MRAGLIVGDLGVQTVARRDGRRSFTIVDAAGVTVEAADGFLRSFERSGTQRTYAFFLVDHLRWLAREGLAAESVRLEDLIRYMGAAGAKLPVPGERPWRVAPRRHYGARALQVAAACVKGFPWARRGPGGPPIVLLPHGCAVTRNVARWLISGTASSAAPCSRRAASTPGSALYAAGLPGTAGRWAVRRAR
jgi:hypothetical protein